MKLGRLVKCKRKELGMTLAEVANQCGFSITYLSQIERSQRLPANQKTLLILAKVLSITETEMIDASRSDVVNCKLDKLGLTERPDNRTMKNLTEVVDHIFNNYEDWKGEASQLAQIHQNDAAYEHWLKEKISLSLSSLADKNTGLTLNEKQAAQHLVDFWNAYVALPDARDTRDVCDAIHRIQAIIGMRVARRANPEFWR